MYFIHRKILPGDRFGTIPSKIIGYIVLIINYTTFTKLSIIITISANNKYTKLNKTFNLFCLIHKYIININIT